MASVVTATPSSSPPNRGQQQGLGCAQPSITGRAYCDIQPPCPTAPKPCRDGVEDILLRPPFPRNPEQLEHATLPERSGGSHARVVAAVAGVAAVEVAAVAAAVVVAAMVVSTQVNAPLLQTLPPIHARRDAPTLLVGASARSASVPHGGSRSRPCTRDCPRRCKPGRRRSTLSVEVCLEVADVLGAVLTDDDARRRRASSQLRHRRCRTPMSLSICKQASCTC